MDFVPLVQNHGTNRAMCDSFIAPGEGELFDQGDLISLFFYGVEEPNKADEDNGYEVMKTPCMLHVKDNTRKSSFLGGEISQRKCCILTGAMFKRLIGLFGYRWAYENQEEKGDDDEPSLEDITSFFAVFKDVDMSTKEGFRRFLSDFQLHELYNMDDGLFDLTVAEHCNNFGHLLRTLVNVRVGAFEGQHRFYLFVLFLTGHYIPDNKTRLTPQDFGTVFPDANYHSMQLWRPLSFKVGVVVGEPAMQQQLQALKWYGKNVTTAQGRHIPVTFQHIMCNVLQEYVHLVEGRTTPCDFANYWTTDNPTPYENLVFAWSAFVKTVEHNGYQEKVVGYSNQKHKDAWEHLKLQAQKRFLKPAYFPRRPALSQSTYVLGIPDRIALFLHMLRCLCYSTTSCRKLIAFLGPPHPDAPQAHPEDPMPHDSFTTNKWMKAFIHVPLLSVNLYLKGKVLIEYTIIRALRKPDAPPEAKALAVSGAQEGSESTDYADYALADFKAIPKSQSSEIKLKDLNGVKTQPAFQKIEFAHNCATFEDVLDTIAAYGFDPAMTNPDPLEEGDDPNKHPANRLMRCYLQ